MSEPWTRRDFLKAGSAVAVGLAASPLAAQAVEGDKPLRCAFIGTGGRGTSLLQTVLGFKDVDVAAICDITPANLANACGLVEKARGKKPEALGAGPYEYRKLLSRDDVDCLVIATPCYWHARMYIDALNAAKPFYGEKPIAITAKEIKLIQAARGAHKNVVAEIGLQWGASKARADAVRRVHEGAIGDLIEGRFFRHNGWATLGRWFDDRLLSGDWMLEQAVHEFNLMWWVTQAHPLSAYTLGRRNVVDPNNAKRNVTDYYSTILEYPKGLTIHYSHGWIDPPGYGGMCTQFIGTKGAIDVLGCSLQVRGQKEPTKGEGPGGDTPEHLRNFFDAARAGKPELVNCGIENGIAGSYIGLIIRKSLDEKRKVTFEEMVDDPQGLPPLPEA
jgi:predicted dehydrogenase